MFGTADEAGEEFSRRDLLNLTGVGVAAFGAAPLFDVSDAEAHRLSETWDKVFARSESVVHGERIHSRCFSKTAYAAAADRRNS